MPPLLGILGSVLGIAGTGLGIGEAVASLTGGGTPSAPKPPAVTPTPPPAPPTAQELLQKRELVSQQLPNVVGQTAGLANPEYDKLIAQILSGVLGSPGANASANAATGQQFQSSNSQPSNAAVTGGDIGLSNFINSFIG